MTKSSAGRARTQTDDSYYNSRRNERIAVSESKASETPQTVIKVSSMDYTAVLVTVLLLLIGVAMVFCAGYVKSSVSKLMNYDMFYYLKKQGLFAIAGFCVAMIMSTINYRVLLRFATPLYLVSNVLLVAVIIMGIASHGQKRWLDLPVVGRFQPSELSKVAVILQVAYIIYRNKNILKKWPGFLFVCALVAGTCGLILPGGLSTTLIVGVIGIGMIFIASPYVLRFVLAGVGGAGALVAYIAVFSSDFRGERFNAWLRPFEDPLRTGYQTIQSLYAIASGGFFGLGIGQSRQKSFLPEAHNDFIFSIICEELGLFGAAVVLLLFGALIWRGIKIAIKAPDLFGSLIASGVVLMIAGQVIINVAVVTRTIPNTGVTLPLVSYGGTSLLITMFLLGVMFNISRYSKE